MMINNPSAAQVADVQGLLKALDAVVKLASSEGAQKLLEQIRAEREAADERLAKAESIERDYADAQARIAAEKAKALELLEAADKAKSEVASEHAALSAARDRVARADADVKAQIASIAAQRDELTRREEALKAAGDRQRREIAINLAAIQAERAKIEEKAAENAQMADQLHERMNKLAALARGE